MIGKLTDFGIQNLYDTALINVMFNAGFIAAPKIDTRTKTDSITNSMGSAGVGAASRIVVVVVVVVVVWKIKDKGLCHKTASSDENVLPVEVPVLFW